MMNEAVQNSPFKQHEDFYIDQDFAMLNGNLEIFRFLLSNQTPFRIEDLRMGIILKGELHAIINLQERHLKTGMIACITPGAIVQPIQISDDFYIRGMAVFTDNVLARAGLRLPAMMNGQIRDFQLTPDEQTTQIIRKLFEALWSVVSHGKNHLSHEVLGCMVGAIINEYAHAFALYSESKRQKKNRNQEIFDRFMALVNQIGGRERQLSYFANRLFLSQRYLGTVIRQVSGMTAKEWLDRATISEAKILLKHSELQVSQIADQLKFPNSSFFCKYFKRLTGMTPNEYKKE